MKSNSHTKSKIHSKKTRFPIGQSIHMQVIHNSTDQMYTMNMYTIHGK